MLLLHTLSRLTFSDQELKPLLAGFLLHFSACQGFKPRLNHCVFCGRRLEEGEPASFDIEEGGLICAECAEKTEGGATYAERPGPTAGAAGYAERSLPMAGGASFQSRFARGRGQTRFPLSSAQIRWVRYALTVGSASWVNSPEAYAPFSVLRPYVENRLGRRIKSALLLPKE